MNGSSPTSVLVGGATGRQGGAVAQTLIATPGFETVALTRRPDSEPARRLSRRGAELRYGDLGEQATLERALEGIDQAFFVTDHTSASRSGGERLQGANMIHAAEQQDLDHVVYSSTIDAHRPPDVPHFASKVAVERRLHRATVQGTVLRPAPFFQNFEAFSPLIRSGFLPFPISADVPLPMLDARDLGRAVSTLLTEATNLWGTTQQLCVGLYTLRELAATVSQVSTFRTVPLPLRNAVVRIAEGPSVARMFRWFDAVGHARETPTTDLPIEMTDFESYLEQGGLLRGNRVPRLVGRISTPLRIYW